MAEFLVKLRYLNFVYGTRPNNYILLKDLLLINTKPNLIDMGHIHKKYLQNYKGSLVCNSETWQKCT